MVPLRRRLLNLLFGLSLLLLVAVAALWVRSYSHVDACGRRTVAPSGARWIDEQFRGDVSSRGGLTALSTKRRAPGGGSREGANFEWRVDPAGWEQGYAAMSAPLLGFESNYKVKWGNNVTLLHDEWRWVRVPYWAALAITAAMAAACLWASRRRARRDKRENKTPTPGATS
jgi:hypothetical protein